MFIRYARMRNNVKTPVRANPSDAGLDVHWNPSHGTLMHNGGADMKINPGDSVILETGLKFEIPHGYMIQVCNRGSMGAKKSLVFGAHIVDSGYDGEVFINLHNISKTPQVIHAGDKIAQLVMTPVISFVCIECSEDELYDADLTISNRGDGSLGSTGS
jgi:dUTP pyrophosphatase